MFPRADDDLARMRERAFSCDLRATKPDASCYHAALARLRAAPSETICIDDRPENVCAANQVGMRGLRFTSVSDTRIALNQYGIAVG